MKLYIKLIENTIFNELKRNGYADDKMRQETFSLKHTGDSFRKVVIDGNPLGARYIDNDGIGHISLIDFLLDPKSIEAI